MKKDFGLAVDAAGSVGVKLALGSEGLRVYEETSEDPACKDLDSRVVFRYLGGREDWRESFPDEVEMKKFETRRMLQKGKEAENEVS
jgi:3-hydroxyisobutyrate dehydrogenase